MSKTLDATNTLAGVAGTGSAVTYTISGDAVSGGADSFKVLAQGVLPTSVGTIYTVPGSTQSIISEIVLVNTTGTAVSGVKLFENGTVAGNQILGSLTIPANGSVTINAAGITTIDAFGASTVPTLFFTGDVTGTGTGSIALTLATVNTNVGTFGDASHTNTITVNGKGLITAIVSNPILITESQVTNLVTDLAGKQAAGNYITALTGDVTASGPGSVAATLASVITAGGPTGSGTAVPVITYDAKGRLTVVTTAATVGSVTAADASITIAGTATAPTFAAGRLDQIATAHLASAAINVNSQLITNVATPVSGGDAANKTYVDTIAAGVRQQHYAQVAKDTNQAALTGLPTVDGITLTTGQSILLTAQNTPAQNGLWLVASGAWTRPTYFATGGDATGSYVFIQQGTVYAGSEWFILGAGPITIDTSNEVWAEVTGTFDITVDSTLVKTGNQIVRAAITGDVTIASGANASVLATVNANVGSFGDGSHVGAFTVNAKGLVTAASSISITPAGIGAQPAGNYITALTGDVSAAGPGSAAATLATVNTNVGTFGDATHTNTITVNAKGLITAIGSNPITLSGLGAGTVATKNIGNTVLDPGTGKLEFAMPTGGLVTGASRTYLSTDRGFIFRRSNSGAAMSDTLPALTNTTADIGYTIVIHNQETVIAGLLTMNASGGAQFIGSTGVTAATSPINYGCRQMFVWDGTQWMLHAGNANLLRRSGTIVAGNFPQFVDTAGNAVIDSGISVASIAATYAPLTRNISTTAPLQGGGPISADLSLTIDGATSTTPGTQSALDYNRMRREWNAYSDFGLIGDLRSVFEVTSSGTQVVMTSGSNVVNIPNAGAATPFLTGRDEGKRITVSGAGASGAMLVGVIGVVSSGTSVTVLASVGGAALNASTTVTASTTVAVGVQWGTDNTVAINTMVATLNGDPFPTPRVVFPHTGRGDWTNAWGFPIPATFTKPVAWEGMGGGHTADVGDYTKIGGTRWAWWGSTSDGGTNFGAMVTVTTPVGGSPVPVLVRAVATPHSSASTNAIGALPTAPANGNLLIALIAIGGASGITVTPPASGGWSLLSGQDLPAGSAAAQYSVYWKAAASEPTSWTWTLSVSRGTVVTIHEISGVRTDIAPQVAVQQTFTGSTSGTTPTLTTTANGAIVLGLAGVVKAASSAAITFTNPGSTTLDAQGGTAVAVASNVSTASLHDTVNQTTAGVTTARTFTASTAPTGGVAYTITAAPAPGSASVQAIKRPSFKSGWFDGRNGDQNQALYLLKMASCHGASLDDGIFFMDALAQGLWLDIGTTAAEAADTTRFLFERLCFRQLDNSTITPPTTTPTTTTFTSVLTTSGASMTLASGTGFAAGGGYAWVQTKTGQPVLIHYTSASGVTLSGVTVSTEDTAWSPQPVSGSFVVPACPNNGGAMKVSGGASHNTSVGIIQGVQMSFGSTWGPAAIEIGNGDSIIWGHIVGNGGSNVNDGAINRIRRPGIRLNGSSISSGQAARNHVFRDVDPGGSPGGPLGGISSMGVDNTGALLAGPAGPNYVELQQMGNGSPVPTIEAGSFLNWSGNGMFKVGPLGTPTSTTQALTAAVANVITGSSFVVPPQGWQVGTRLRWRIALTKTAVGTSWTATVRQASTITAGSGTAIASTTFTATAAIDAGYLDIDLVCDSLGGSGTVKGRMTVQHMLAATGLATGAVTAGTAIGPASTAGLAMATPAFVAFNTSAAASGVTFVFVEINPVTASTVMAVQVPVEAACVAAGN